MEALDKTVAELEAEEQTAKNLTETQVLFRAPRLPAEPPTLHATVRGGAAPPPFPPDFLSGQDRGRW